ncbi:cell envelope integrity protein CreD [Lysobacter sp. ISL-42]|nr:cell envelope integrity protein CreD [Lysobacter sp. ISL-42]MBT2751342.1 cell envelope integrity protein CreD [Lysobacter sp. ISL-50]MBT2776547.1 cell envelope integrity protein CreD [Lysobacter sp. ISL-54]MBT2781041.1 cell envelope integrity protein CreD [Lysobacter sp. ISL-52]
MSHPRSAQRLQPAVHIADWSKDMRVWLKMLMVLGMTLAILIPLLMIGGIISDRQTYRAQAVATVARSYAGAQAFSGPALVVPYEDTWISEEKDDKGDIKRVAHREQGRWTYFPNKLAVEGDIAPKVRPLGLYKVLVYEWTGKAKADFVANIPANPVAEPGMTVSGITRSIGKPWLSYAFADVRGLRDPKLRLDGMEVAIEDGLGARDGGGIHARLAAPAAGTSLRLQTDLDFVLGGTESLALVPLGKDSRFSLRSSWPHPNYGGSFPPSSDSIGDTGFRADWRVSSVATNAQRQYLTGAILPSVEVVGNDAADSTVGGEINAVQITLKDPVNVYSQADRATKYGLLFVLLTFVGFFMFELIKQLRIHPIQYGLVGLALAIFFLLLVSLSEHMDFGLSYLIASVACIGLLVFYLSAVLGGVVRALGFGAMLVTLYGSLYGLLISEDNALVLGAGLLFLILATIMVVTRKVDWYQLGGAAPKREPANPRAMPARPLDPSDEAAV